MSKDIDSKVLEYLKGICGSSVWAMKVKVSETAYEINISLQRLKKSGEVDAVGLYWYSM